MSFIESVCSEKERSWSVSKDRLLLMFWVFVYGGSIVLGHEKYLAVEQTFWGYGQPYYDLVTLLVAFLFLMVSAAFLPLSFERPSSLFIYAIFFFVYVPSLMIAMLSHEDSLDRYFWLFFNFSVGLVVCCIAVRCGGAFKEGNKHPSELVVYVSLLGGGLCFAILYATYGAILSFSGLDQVYQQREAGAATSLFVGYCQVYLAYVFSPCLFVIGLLYKRFLLLLGGLAGFVFVYMITAERTVLLLPFALFFIFLMFKWRGFGAKNSRNLFAVGALGVVLVSSLFDISGVFNQLGFYYFTRLIAVPGLFVSQYYDFFSVEGYTYWSHVTFIGGLVETPLAYVGDEKWPALGKIIAERVMGVESQSNASFVATDGVAALGSIGVFLIFLVYSIWLLVLDRVANGWSKMFVIMVLFPLAFLSTNGSMFTMLTSFGGVFWLSVFFADKYSIRLTRGRNE
ncbi:hypothetical protein [Pseudomonas akapageensis]|uniref:hypothetical protein n=1 Tax=Pseudomonas akapageensis TaxID=2609961 RepID=UPI001FE64B3C|nr:hypothetical protein [Pseudomonas akapageensis]